MRQFLGIVGIGASATHADYERRRGQRDRSKVQTPRIRSDLQASPGASMPEKAEIGPIRIWGTLAASKRPVGLK